MVDDERILAGPWTVFTFSGGPWQRLKDLVARPSKSYGYLLVTSRRIAFLREFPSGRIRETETSLVFTGSLRSEGWETYQPSDLAHDARHPANLTIPLAKITAVRVIGQDDATLELEVTNHTARHLRFYRLGHLQRSLWFATPMPSREPMSDIAAAIEEAQRTPRS